ncbi:hypothetical protein PR048_028790 [Dryococelus australis]|uniref:Uncharacterized protein n=1 Tax=Dryococelus australis TaxID=614101 RepID=A0ABQ9GBJ1_9NEOP|nr:hypothetical protein PR048_028790 [Dryococelus australis]
MLKLLCAFSTTQTSGRGTVTCPNKILPSTWSLTCRWGFHPIKSFKDRSSRCLLSMNGESHQNQWKHCQGAVRGFMGKSAKKFRENKYNTVIKWPTHIMLGTWWFVAIMPIAVRLNIFPPNHLCNSTASPFTVLLGDPANDFDVKKGPSQPT